MIGQCRGVVGRASVRRTGIEVLSATDEALHETDDCNDSNNRNYMVDITTDQQLCMSCDGSQAETLMEFDVGANVTATCTPVSPRKQVQLKHQLQLYHQKTRLLHNRNRRLQRRLLIMGRKQRIANNALCRVFHPDQIRALESKSCRGKRWSKETLKTSLQTLCACGPSGYSILQQQGYPLPSTRTLRRSLEGLRFNSGILDKVFDSLALKTTQMCEKERTSTLVLDEMSIKSSVEFDVRTGTILGQVTLPGHHGKATHALVLMLAGVSSRWKQVVAYYFTGNSVYGSALKPIVVNLLKKAHTIGLEVVAVTSDMGAGNRAMWKSFGVQCGKYVTTVNKVASPVSPSNSVHFLADAPHLLKNLKAALVNGQEVKLPDWVVIKYSLPSNVVTVQHLHTLVEFQTTMELKLSPALNAKTLRPSHFDKMKVSNAAHVFSHANGAALEYLVKLHSHSKELLTTAWFLKTVCHWFDIVTSRRRALAVSLHSPAKYQATRDFLLEVIQIF